MKGVTEKITRKAMAEIIGDFYRQDMDVDDMRVLDVGMVVDSVEKKVEADLDKLAETIKLLLTGYIDQTL